jgi:hypothetical protein
MFSNASMGKPATALIAFVCGITLAGGVAATAAAKSKTVKACVTSKHFLATAQKNKCPHGTHALKLGVTGPRGAAGHSGTNGLSQALAGRDDYLTAPSPLPGATEATVADVANAPAGHYVATYTIDAKDTGAASASLFCQLATAADATQGLNNYMTTAIAPGYEDTQSNTSTLTLATASPVVVRCSGSIGQSVTAYAANFTMIPVNTIVATGS